MHINYRSLPLVASILVQAGIWLAPQSVVAQSTAELQKELAESRARLEVAMKKMAAMEAEMAKTMENGRAQQAQLEAQQAQLKAERDQMQAKIVSMTDNWTQRELALMKTIVELRTKLAEQPKLEPVRVHTVAPRTLKINALIASVDREGRLQITAGTRHGLQVGDILDVYRTVDKQKLRLGKAEVVLVNPDLSICRIKDDPKPLPITNGDRVTSEKLPEPAFRPHRVPLLDNGKVIGVEEDGTIVISFGSQDGIQQGHRILIYREKGETGVSVGEFEVKTAQKTSAQCVPVTTLNMLPKEGDRAATKPWAGSSAKVY